MIVVDTNVVAYLFIPGGKRPLASRALEKDPVWAVPLLWRSEFRNVLALYMRQGRLSLADAVQLTSKAEAFLQGTQHQVDSGPVLSLVARSKCTAYDCEFVALAQRLGVRLVTTDDLILAEFPGTAVALDDFVKE